MPENIQSMPTLDEFSFKYFKETLKYTGCFLEYGCGGSTIYAAKTAKIPTIIPVESDKNWYESIKTAVSSTNTNLYIVYCDVGEVGAWGTPKNNDKIDNFWMYMVKPWHIAQANDLAPDTILIDGRFRVASFLFSLVSANSGTTILFDDYVNRRYYHVVEEFCELQEEVGRMGVFSVNKNFSIPEICEKNAEHSISWK